MNKISQIGINFRFSFHDTYKHKHKRICEDLRNLENSSISVHLIGNILGFWACNNFICLVCPVNKSGVSYNLKNNYGEIIKTVTMTNTGFKFILFQPCIELSLYCINMTVGAQTCFIWMYKTELNYKTEQQSGENIIVQHIHHCLYTLTFLIKRRVFVGFAGAVTGAAGQVSRWVMRARGFASGSFPQLTRAPQCDPS